MIGRKLVGLEVNNQRVEAELRRSLVLLEAAPATECIVIEKDEESSSDPGAPSSLSRPSFDRLWQAIQSNYAGLFQNFLYLNLWLTSFDQLLIILPYLLVAPFLFYTDDRRVKMGVLIKLSDSFGKVFGSLSVIAESWVAINEFASAVVRLRQFEKNLRDQAKDEQDDAQLVPHDIQRSNDKADGADPPSPPYTDPPLSKPVPPQLELAERPRHQNNGERTANHAETNHEDDEDDANHRV